MNRRYTGLIARIATLVVIIEIVVFGLLGAFYSNRFSDIAEEQIHSRLRLIARMIGQDELPVSAVSAQRLIADFVGAPYESGVLVSGGGRVIVSLDPGLLGRTLDGIAPFDRDGLSLGDQSERLLTTDDHMTYVARIGSGAGDATLYTLYLTINIADLNAKKRSIALLGWELSGLFILISSLAILLVAQRLITRRLDASLAVLKQIEDGDLEARIAVSSPDELGQLQLGINSMTSTISALLVQHRRNEEEITAILDAISDGVVAVGAKGEILRCNPSASQFLAAPHDKVTGRDLAEVFPALAARLETAPADGSAAGDDIVSLQLELPVAEDGSKVVDLGQGFITEQDGSIIGRVLVLHDITERIQVENQLRNAVERLTVSNSELERFAYVASHDLQEPLRTIVSFTQLLEKRWEDSLPPEAREYSSFVIQAAKHMRLLINDLLAFSKVNSKSGRREQVSLRDACEVALRNLNESIAESDAEVALGGLPDLFGDKMQLIQLFQNLIGNALKFRRPEVRPYIEVTAERQEGGWRIDIRDNGIGIEPTQKDVFEIFSRLHTKEKYAGSGVGLAICKRIVLRHDGRIWYDSRLGEGTTFHVFLPVEASALGSADAEVGVA